MTKRIEKKTVEVERIVSSTTFCDKCGQEIKRSGWGDVFECKFELKTGQNYGYTGNTKSNLMDLCNECGEEALSLLIENGFGFYEEGTSF